ncbi:MAG: UDP-N-acetylglucosamine 1-carboxyvinyltransferase [Candidatus Omnitrophica bacterium]|nr:UDP-N-acetylglucosamine 1-carboxyvinyltransferase [Candidatus Omnitrophota bacterium]
MDKLIIEGGKPLKGEVKISGSKNATLPVLAATLLTDETCILRNVPKLTDTNTMIKLLKSLGKEIDWDKDKLIIMSNGKVNHIADYKMVATMRGSICVLGPLLTKLGEAKVSLPGGCVIGVRPVDLHIKGVEALGAKVDVDAGYIIAKAKRLKGSRVYLGGASGPSVLGTANIMMAATLADGETIIECAACEPEVEELANFLNEMGARIRGQGSPRIVIQGVKKLHGADYKMAPDRIEAGTFVLLSAMSKSTFMIRDIDYQQLMALDDILIKVGVQVEADKSGVRVKPPKILKPMSITTYPYPGFPTDLQAQYTALMAMANGVSVIRDTVFPDRFMHIAELNRMGARIRREGGSAIIEGVKSLCGAPVVASDLRASAALVMAGLVARGKTEIRRVYHLDRGYENIDKKLIALGASIKREKE